MPAEATTEVIAPQPEVAAPPMSEDDALSAAYDAIQNEGEETDATAPAVAEVKPDAEVDAKAEPEADEVAEAESAKEDAAPEEEKPEAAAEAPPKHLPVAVKREWDKMTPEVREAISQSQLEMSQKLASQGREMSAIKPLREILVNAIEKMPGLADMKPDQLGREIFEVAQLTSGFQSDPVRTMIGLIQRHNLGPQMAQVFAGQQPTGNQSELAAEIRSLKHQLAAVNDPQSQREQFAAWSEEDRTTSAVEKFAAEADHWAEVEKLIPNAIQFVQAQSPNVSPEDTLKAAYDLAVTQTLGPQAPPQPSADPQRAAAVANAKNMNVNGKRSGKPRELTEDEALSAAFDRISAG